MVTYREPEVPSIPEQDEWFEWCREQPHKGDIKPEVYRPPAPDSWMSPGQFMFLYWPVTKDEE